MLVFFNWENLFVSISPNSEYLAFADDHKQLTVWSWKENQVDLVRQWNTVRRANKIIFDKDGVTKTVPYRAPKSRPFKNTIEIQA